MTKAALAILAALVVGSVAMAQRGPGVGRFPAGTVSTGGGSAEIGPDAGLNALTVNLLTVNTDAGIGRNLHVVGDAGIAGNLGVIGGFSASDDAGVGRNLVVHNLSILDGGFAMNGAIGYWGQTNGGVDIHTLGSSLVVVAGSSTIATFNGTSGNTDVTFGVKFGGALSLGTCAAGVEGTVKMDSTSGVSTGAVTRWCGCASNGSATYTWNNLTTGTVGTATTCSP